MSSIPLGGSLPLIQEGTTYLSSKLRLHYRVAGSRGPVLLLLHGIGASSRWWQRNMATLASQYRVYALDLPGFGESRPKRSFSLEQAVEAIMAWMDAQGIVVTGLVAHSMGGLIALHLAARAPERVRRLILVNPVVLPLAGSCISLLWRCLRTRRVSRQPPSTSLLLRTLTQAGPLVLWHAWRMLQQANIQALRVTMPTLILWGRRDTLLSLAHATALANVLDQAQLRVLDAGHSVFYEYPDVFHQHLLRFAVPPACCDQASAINISACTPSTPAHTHCYMHEHDPRRQSLKAE